MTTTVLEVRAVAVEQDLAIERLARESGLHPERRCRLVNLGLVRPHITPPAAPALWPGPCRLRAPGVSKYAGACAPAKLLARIDRTFKRNSTLTSEVT